MMGGQKQSIGDNSTAIQADGNITINQGLSTTQMYQIMKELREIVDDFTAEAKNKADIRFQQFQNEMLEKFKDEKIANSNAFKEPDFQFILKEAQISYARSDNDVTNKLLIELLAKRSNSPHRDRISLILNEATAKVNKLTDEDLSVVTLCFILLYSSINPNNRIQLIETLNKILSPLIPMLETDTSCYTYLESIGCITINTMRSIDLIDVLIRNYQKYWTDGFTVNEIKHAIKYDDEKLNKMRILLTPLETGLYVQNNHAYVDINVTKLIFTINDESELKEQLTNIGLTHDDCQAIFSLIQTKKWDKAKTSDYLKDNVTGFSDLNNIWSNVNVQHTSLTSVGIAIAHAHLNNVWPEFKTPLNVWVK